MIFTDHMVMRPRITSSLIRTLLLYFWLVNSAPATAKTCQIHNTDHPSVPECPTSGDGVLSESYPAMAVSISDAMGGTRWVKEFVEAALEAQPDQPPVFVLNVRAETLREVQKMIRQKSVSPERKKLWLGALSHLKLPDVDVYNWQQDFFQSFIESGKPVLRINGAYSRARTVRDAVINSIEESCGIKVGTPYQANRSDLSGRMGGNIEGGPGGLCVVGSDSLLAHEWEALTNDVCAKSPKLKAPTDFLAVGHTDEVITTIRTGPGSCDLSYLVASPREALAAMKSAPGAPAFLDPNLRPETTVEKLPPHEDTDTMTYFYADLCDSIDRLPTEDHTEIPQPRSSRSQAKQMSPRTPPRAVASEWAKSACPERLAHLNNSDLVRLVETEPNMKLVNSEAQRRLDLFKQELKAKLTELGCPSVPMIDVPKLFMGSAIDHGMLHGKPWIDVKRGSSVFGNSLNMQQFGNHLIMTDPLNSAMRKRIESQLKSANPDLRIKFINAQFAHLTHGGVHCSTNTVRYCRKVSRGSSGP